MTRDRNLHCISALCIGPAHNVSELPSLFHHPVPSLVREGWGEEGRGGEGWVGPAEEDVVGRVNGQGRQIILECGQFCLW